jgi:hypothetical protein
VTATSRSTATASALIGGLLGGADGKGVVFPLSRAVCMAAFSTVAMAAANIRLADESRLNLAAGRRVGFAAFTTT